MYVTDISKIVRAGEECYKLEAIFARFGIPKIVFTDNGTQLVSNEMHEFGKKFDFKIVTQSPTYPQSNGLAEAAVKIAKKNPWLLTTSCCAIELSSDVNVGRL